MLLETMGKLQRSVGEDDGGWDIHLTHDQKKLARKWVDALRSGEYTRSVGGLKRGGCFCCLGVLCDVVAKDGVGEWVPYDGTIGPDEVFAVGDERGVCCLPPTVHEMVGFDVNGGVHAALVYLNDIRGVSFDEIADMLEKDFGLV